MSERSTQSESIELLAAAMAKAQSLIRGATRESENPHLGKKYADLISVWDACREPLTSNGLTVIQCPEPSESGWVTISSQLLHESGQFIRSEISLPVEKQNAQGYGAAITYARRYALSSMVGIAPDDDDDGHSASNGAASKQQSQQPRRETPRQAAPQSNRPPQRQTPVPESAGDRAAAGQRQGAGQQRAMDAVKAGETTTYAEKMGLPKPEMAAPAAVEDPERAEARADFFGLGSDHCGAENFKSLFRAVASILAGHPEPYESLKPWTAENFKWAHGKIRDHVEVGCAGGDECELVAQAMVLMSKATAETEKGPTTEPAPPAATPPAAKAEPSKPASPPAAEVPKSNGQQEAPPMVCSEASCGVALKKGPYDISMRAYGRPLCPPCQKQHARAAA